MQSICDMGTQQTKKNDLRKELVCTVHKFIFPIGLIFSVSRWNYLIYYVINITGVQGDVLLQRAYVFPWSQDAVQYTHNRKNNYIILIFF